MLSQVFLRAQYSAFDEYLLTVWCALPTATPCTRGGACVSRHALAYTLLILMWGIQSCPTPGACLLCLHVCAISNLHVSVNLYVTAICSAWFPRVHIRSHCAHWLPLCHINSGVVAGWNLPSCSQEHAMEPEEYREVESKSEDATGG